MGRKLYQLNLSTPSQTVRFTGSCLGLDFDMISIDPRLGQNKEEEFLKINPQHKIPVLVDEDGFIIRESRTICRYLAQKYGNHSLYPQELKARTEVDMILDFDIGTLYRFFYSYWISIVRDHENPSEEILSSLTDALTVLETILDRSESGWVAANQFTIADISLFTSIIFLTLLEYDLSQYSNILKWSSSVRDKIPEFEAMFEPCKTGVLELYREFKERENE